MENIRELKEVELNDINGGWIKVLAGAAIGYGVYLYDNRDRFIKGFMAGLEN
jgi:hypothetical protein